MSNELNSYNMRLLSKRLNSSLYGKLMHFVYAKSTRLVTKIPFVCGYTDAG